MGMTVEQLETKARELRISIVRMIGVGRKGHLGGSCSMADVVAALYYSVMRLDPKNPDWPDRDRFLLSKGHAALVQYAALADLGYFPEEELTRVKQLGSMLQGHPDMANTPGIEANTGSLGQGLSIACGMAAGLKLDGRPSRVYCIVGDGELAEGQIWEAAMAASCYRLDNLVAVLDRNGIQATGPTRELFDLDPLAEKWQASGWDVRQIDGHDMRAVLGGLAEADKVRDRPAIVIAQTVKGKGVSFAENTAAFHNGMMTQEQYDRALAELSVSKGL